MSFTVKDGTETVYTLPTAAGTVGDVLGIDTNGVLNWNTPSLGSGRHSGEIVMWWNGPSNYSLHGNATDGYHPKIDDTVYGDWYLCNGDGPSGVPDMTDCFTIGCNNIGLSSSENPGRVDGTNTITENVPIPDHKHTYDRSQGTRATANSSVSEFVGAHTYQNSTANTYGLHNGNWGATTDSYKTTGGGTFSGIQPGAWSSTFETPPALNHAEISSHSHIVTHPTDYFQYLDANTDGVTDASTGNGVIATDFKYKYYKLFYIIYLPQ